MSEKKRAFVLISSLLIVMGIALCVAFTSDSSPRGGAMVASRIERLVGRRLSLLQIFSRNVLESPASEWPEMENIPGDMVIYRYCSDTLQSWINQFPIVNDDIRGRVLAPRLVNPRMQPDSPLSEVGEAPGFYNFGSKWYLAGTFSKSGVKVLYGLELVDTQDGRSFNGVNPLLNLSDKYSIRPLNYSEGFIVNVGGKPSFKIICERLASGDSGGLQLFSPLLYADAPLFPSLGALLLINLILTILCFALSAVKKEKRKQSLRALLSVAILAFSAVSLRSIILNSNISLELYRYSDLSIYSLLVYASYIFLFLGLPFLLGADVKSRLFRLCYSSLIAAFFLVMSSLLGNMKEKAKVEVWADRLTVNRDISLEMQLRRVEKDIEDDILIGTLSRIKDASPTIQGRLEETYLRRYTRSYNIRVFTVFDKPPRIDGGEPVADGSHFVYIDNPGAPVYAGMFLYGEGASKTSVLVLLEQRDDKSDRGFLKLFNLTPPGKVSIPSKYSYARYRDGVIVSCKGSYPYPMSVSNTRTGTYDNAGYVHFSHQVTDSELVIISRPKINVFNYITELLFLFLVAFASVTFLNIGQRERPTESNSYRRRITRLIIASLIVTLVAMATVSVVFVVSRNDSNQRNVMSEKIRLIQTSLESALRPDLTMESLRSPEFARELEKTAVNANTDITVFTADGRILLSTSPFVYESLFLDGRMNGKAYDKIVYEGRRYFLNNEKAGGVNYQNMYAPLLDSDGHLIAIVCSPFTLESYDFEEDALNHSLTVISVFLILMLIARMLTKTILNKMLGPLSEMGLKMRAAGLDTLEYIKYDNDDEISNLVQSYNRMVTDLSESTARLAQAERDKAWSGMARQVAHEIKNPLTPMKLQIQRIIRLKEKNDPTWIEKFDEMSKVLLDHIDILTDTANQFSTFAKLYTEEPTKINLDTVLQEEISMFDSSSGIKFEYRGLENSFVSGPKPQLVRVFVNLLGNAVQAVGEDGMVLVSLRKSIRDGYYDIVVEDNGGGVSEENIDKLFSPNFTTKSGGSGLGLAISRSILEKCGATIEYSRSFSLGGACFTVRYPIISA